jgi:DNA-binding IclR family transcriptional regulator
MTYPPLTPDEITVLTVMAHYPVRKLSAAELAREVALAPTLARRTAEGLVAKGLLGRTGNLYHPVAVVD